MDAGTPRPDGRRVVIIGAGIGGLAAALRLAHAGMHVTVIEASAGPGGKMRQMPSAAGPVDAGPTVLTMRGVFDDLFSAAGTRIEDHITLIPQPVLARHWWPDLGPFDLHHDIQASVQSVADTFGSRSAEEFRRFHARTAQAFGAFKAPLMQAAHPEKWRVAMAALANPALWPMLAPGMTMARHLALQFSDKRLRQLFGRYATYVGGIPGKAPAILSLIWQAEAGGVWAPVGGMHALARTVEALAKAGGAQFRYGTAVERIVEQWGRVASVVLTDGSRIPADHILFNGDPLALTGGLLGPAARRAVPPRATSPRSLSACVWSFAARPKGPDLAYHNVFFTGDPAREFGPIARGGLPDEPTLYICAEDRASGTPGQAQAERFEIIMNAPAGLPATAATEAACHPLIFHTLSRFGLTFDPTPTSATLATPASFAQMFPGSQGALYGLSPHGLTAAFRRPGARTALPGLYLTGGGAHPGAGVPMAALSGRHAAEAILTDRISALKLAPMVMPGGTSTGSATAERGPFPSSPS
jgi:1-hydroxycarotenoid 3,4-desaturase